MTITVDVTQKDIDVAIANAEFIGKRSCFSSPLSLAVSRVTRTSFADFGNILMERKGGNIISLSQSETQYSYDWSYGGTASPLTCVFDVAI